MTQPGSIELGARRSRGRVRRAVALVVAALGLGGICMGGCATGNARRDEKVAEIGGRPPNPTPPHGWSNYRADRRPYEPDPARAAATQSLVPNTNVGDPLR
jgi:hypothetical protein